MIRPGTFERVYAAIKEKLRQGQFRPGDRLEPALLSEQLNASVTPVRDALHRLTGERLIEAPRHEGFRVPLLTETMLRQLYRWHRDLLLLAILKRPGVERINDEAVTGNAIPGHERRNALFLALVRSVGSPEHTIALEALAERLSPVQRFEDLLLDAAESETAQILEALRSGDRRELRRALQRYHRRRQQIVPFLIDAIYANSDAPLG
jgi:DNA-binding GntR family transcriptional regulator